MKTIPQKNAKGAKGRGFPIPVAWLVWLLAILVVILAESLFGQATYVPVNTSPSAPWSQQAHTINTNFAVLASNVNWIMQNCCGGTPATNTYTADLDTFTADNTTLTADLQ